MSGANKPWLSIGKTSRLSIAIFAILQVCCLASHAVFAQTGSMQQPTLEQNYRPRTYQGRLEADDGQWTRPAKDDTDTVR